MHDDATALTHALADDLDGHFEALVHTYGARLYGFALRLTGSPPDAEEIAQDAFVRAYRALRCYEPARIRDLALRPWLYRIALNVTRNRVRGKRPRLVPLAAADADGDDDRNGAIEPRADERDEPEVVSARLADGAELAALVAGLPSRYRAAVVLRHVQGLSYQEIADALEQPVGTVKANVHRGIRSLRDALTEATSREPAAAGTRR